MIVYFTEHKAQRSRVSRKKHFVYSLLTERHVSGQRAIIRLVRVEEKNAQFRDLTVL
jgi:hypothetical protein